MRMLLLISAVAVVIVGGIAIYANAFLGRVKNKQTELEQTLRDEAEGLRVLDETFRAPAKGPLGEKRFLEWLAIRTSLALLLEGRFQEKAEDTWFHQQETRIALVERLREELTKRKMSLAEYRAITERFQALLALPEFEALRRDWLAKTKSRRHPDGLPLPAPAEDAGAPERQLLRDHAEPLKEAAGADLMLPLLDDIAAGKLPGPPER